MIVEISSPISNTVGDRRTFLEDVEIHKKKSQFDGIVKATLENALNVMYAYHAGNSLKPNFPNQPTDQLTTSAIV